MNFYMGYDDMPLKRKLLAKLSMGTSCSVDIFQERISDLLQYPAYVWFSQDVFLVEAKGDLTQQDIKSSTSTHTNKMGQKVKNAKHTFATQKIWNTYDTNFLDRQHCILPLSKKGETIEDVCSPSRNVHYSNF